VRKLVVATSLLGTLLHSTPSFAGEAEDKDRARELIRVALDNLEKSDFETALASAEEAEALYHAPIHLEVVGRALEGLERLAEAADLYERLATEPLPATAHKVFLEAQETARKRLRELGAKVPSVLLRIRGTSEDVQVWVDDRELDYAKGVARRVDSGERRLRVEAPGVEPYEKTLNLPAKGGVVVVEVNLGASGSEGTQEDPPGGDGGGEGSLVPAYVAFGVGAIGLGVGAITGIMSLGKASDLEESCPEKQCTAADQADFDSATTLGTISTIGFVVGAVGAAAGAVLFVVRPGGGEAEGSEGGVHLRMKANVGGFMLDGRF